MNMKYLRAEAILQVQHGAHWRQIIDDGRRKDIHLKSWEMRYGNGQPVSSYTTCQNVPRDRRATAASQGYGERGKICWGSCRVHKLTVCDPWLLGAITNDAGEGLEERGTIYQDR